MDILYNLIVMFNDIKMDQQMDLENPVSFGF